MKKLLVPSILILAITSIIALMPTASATTTITTIQKTITITSTYSGYT